MKIKFIFILLSLLFSSFDSGGDTAGESLNNLLLHKDFIYTQKDQTQFDNNDIVKRLPVVITGTNIQNKYIPVALLISGDGGWFGF